MSSYNLNSNTQNVPNYKLQCHKSIQFTSETYVYIFYICISIDTLLRGIQQIIIKNHYLTIFYVEISYYLYFLQVSFPKMEAQREDLYHSVSVQGKARVALVLRDN